MVLPASGVRLDCCPRMTPELLAVEPPLPPGDRGNMYISSPSRCPLRLLFPSFSLSPSLLIVSSRSSTTVGFHGLQSSLCVHSLIARSYTLFLGICHHTFFLVFKPCRF